MLVDPTIILFNRMSINIVSILADRESGRKNRTKISVVLSMVDDLYKREFLFDHPVVEVIAVYIKQLAVRLPYVRQELIDVDWDRDFGGVKSLVLLADKLSRSLSQCQESVLSSMVDEVKSTY